MSDIAGAMAKERRQAQCAPPVGEVVCGDCLDVMRGWPDGCIDAIVTDPPYGLSFMGKRWDYDVPSVEIWTECLRVLKDGGRLLAFSGARTQHRMVCRIEDAGFVIEDCMMWLYGSGFPKHKSKLKPAYEPICVARKGSVSELNIDAGRIATSDHYSYPNGAGGSTFSVGGGTDGTRTAPAESHPAGRWPANVCMDEAAALALDQQSGVSVSVPRTPSRTHHTGGVTDFERGSETSLHSDSGGASRFLKVAKWGADDENIYRAKAVLDRWNKDFANTAEPGLSLSSEHAAFALSVAVTLASQGAIQSSGWMGLSTNVTASELKQLAMSAIIATLNIGGESLQGPLPGKLILSSSPASDAEALKQTGITTITASLSKSVGFVEPVTSDIMQQSLEVGEAAYRFRYVAKADRAEREAGCGLLSEASCGVGALRDASRGKSAANTHPTVKPVELMRWLIRLVAQPGQVVLDPFFGSGTTGVAANREGIGWIGIELNPDYAEIARARTAQQGLFTGGGNE